MKLFYQDSPITLEEFAAMSTPSNETVATESPALEPVRYSRLRLFGQSPAHYHADQVVRTPCMEQGSALDALVLSTSPLVAYPGKQRRGKDWEAWKVDQDPKAMIVTKKQASVAEAMRAAVAASEPAMSKLAGHHQKEIEWQYLGRKCVSHLDVMALDCAYVTELKASQTSNPNQFRWKALKMAYHAQLAFYRLAVEYLTGTKPRTAYIVAVESSAPYVVTTLRLTDRVLELGERMVRIWFEQLLQCESSNQWPGYAQSIVDLDAPDDVDLNFDLNELVKEDSSDDEENLIA